MRRDSGLTKGNTKLSVGTAMPIILENPGQRGTTGFYPGVTMKRISLRHFLELGVFADETIPSRYNFRAAPTKKLPIQRLHDDVSAFSGAA
jgi:hypothetical protein